MSHLQLKSQQNLLAASILLEQQLYAPVFHCAYYSVLQMMTHFVMVKKGISDLEVNLERNRMNQSSMHGTRHVSSHEHIFNETIELLTHAKANHRVIIGKCNSLKRLRTTSDYFDVPIQNNRAQIAITDAAAVISELARL